MAEARLKTNLDTNFIKLIAILSMTVDHVGSAFFPEYPAFRWIGRIAFPLFCYCMTVGMLYTHDIKKYALRLGAFALISQPFWILAFHADDIAGNLLNLNIFFTLLVSLLSVWGFKEKKWWLFAAGLILLNVINFDYAMTGLILMLIFSVGPIFFAFYMSLTDWQLSGAGSFIGLENFKELFADEAT